MNYKTTLAAAAVAFALPVAASAATIDMISGGTYSINEDTVGVLHAYNLLVTDPTAFDGAELTFTFTNDLGSAVNLEVSTTASVIPDETAGSNPDALGGFGSPTVAIPDDGNEDFFYTMDIEEEITFFVRLGDVTPNYELDVLVVPNEVPVPAAGFLLLGGLGGLAMMRRRKKS